VAGVFESEISGDAGREIEETAEGLCTVVGYLLMN